MAMYLYMPDIQDKYLKATQFYDLVDSKTMKAVMVNIIMIELQQLLTYMHNSAFCSIWFGDNPNGVY